MTQVPALKTQRLQIGGMDCTSCAMKIENAVEQLAGVAEISVVVATGRLLVTYDPDRVSEVDIKQRVTGLGYTIEGDKSKSQAQHSSHDHSSHNYGSHDDGDENGDDHAHSGGQFSLQREGILVAIVIALYGGCEK